MTKRTVFALGIIVAALSLSCAPSISRGGTYGNIRIDFAGSSARSLAAGWPDDTIPTFSTVTVTVSADDMATVTATASGSTGSIRLQVPVGNDRRVEVIAVPAAGGGAPFLAKTYSGTAAVDLAEGQETSVAVTLTMRESKIVLPSSGSPGTLAIAESLSGSVSSPTQVYLSDAADFELDRYGRGFVAGYGITLFTSLMEMTPLSDSGIEVLGIAYDASLNGLYSFEDTNGVYLRYRDLDGETFSQFDVGMSSEAPFDDYYGLALAAGDGFLYTTAFSYNQDAYGIGKFTVAISGETAQATLVTFTAYSALGIDYASGLKVNDMVVRDGVLYVAAAAHGNPNGNTYPYYLDLLKSRGKVVALSAADLTVLWDLGLSDTPMPTSPATEFYGPARFVAVAPRKLYVADEGYSWEDNFLEDYDYVADVNRVVEIDLDTGEISAIGLDGEAAFFDDFSGYYAVGVNY